jgi:dCMP deaminase
MYIFGTSVDGGSVIDAFPCFICKKMIINAGLTRVVCSTAAGTPSVFLIEDWARAWREGDILDDTHQYGS